MHGDSLTSSERNYIFQFSSFHHFEFFFYWMFPVFFSFRHVFLLLGHIRVLHALFCSFLFFLFSSFSLFFFNSSSFSSLVFLSLFLLFYFSSFSFISFNVVPSPSTLTITLTSFFLFSFLPRLYLPLHNIYPLYNPLTTSLPPPRNGR